MQKLSMPLHFHRPLRDEEKEILLFISFIASLLILAYIVPVGFYISPTGSDVYTHLYNTIRMVDSNSLYQFYEKSFTSEYLGYDYPFGMWYFGSIVVKVTGMDINEFVLIFPIIFLSISLFIYYIYAKKILSSPNKSVLSIIFLITMPLLVLNLMNYSTSQFVWIFPVIILFFSMKPFDIRNLVIIGLLIFALVFTHTGTFMFLIFFSTGYFILYALVWRKYNYTMFSVIVTSLFMYIYAIRLFPFVQPQYIDKGRMVLSISNWLSKVLNLRTVNDLGNIFYDNLFISNSIAYAIFWSCLIFTAGVMALHLNMKISSFVSRKEYAIPIIGNISNISHSILSTPFWVGPIQSILSIFGVFKLNSEGKCIFLTLVFAVILPGALQSSEGTGALREIQYLQLIIPLCAAEGYYQILSYLAKGSHIRGEKGRSNQGISRIKVFTILFSVMIFFPLIIVPIYGNLHYQPELFGTTNEKQNLVWLSTIGNESEGLPGYVYRERINMYAKKATPSIPPGSETKRYMLDLDKIYFSKNAEAYADDLYSFNIQYLIASQRIMGSFSTVGKYFQTDSNEKLDRIYSSDNSYAIYKYIPPSVNQKMTETPIGEGQVNIVEGVSAPQDYGPVYLFENGYYKMKLNHNNPEIKYIGSRTENILGEGVFSDYVTISWPATQGENSVTYNLNELQYPDIIQENNRLSYKTTIRDPHSSENWATLIVLYTFYEKAVGREIIIANDWKDTSTDNIMSAGVSSSIFAPVAEFSFNQVAGDGDRMQTKRVYPSQDTIVLKNKLVNEVYFQGISSGFMVSYGKTAPYPTTIYYKGSTIYDYSEVTIDSTNYLLPSEPMTISQYFSVGDLSTARANIDPYTQVSLNDFPGATIPVAIAGFIDEGESSKRGLEKVRILGIPYQEISRSWEDTISNVTASHPIGYLSIPGTEPSLSPDAIEKALVRIKELPGTKGMYFPYYRYNLNTVHALSDNGFMFLLSPPVSSPQEEFNREGLRNLKMAYYHGEKTGIVLVPVTLPESSVLNQNSNTGEVFSQWNETLDAVKDDGGIATFLWSAKDLGDPTFIPKFDILMERLKAKGMAVSDLEPITAHFRQKQNIIVRSKMGLDDANLIVINKNPDTVAGMSCQVHMPAIGGECPYKATNGQILRSDLTEETCQLTVSFDLEAGEEKNIIIQPDIHKNLFTPEIPLLFEGTNILSIKDESGKPVSNVTLSIDEKKYETDYNGEASFWIRRGIHQVKIEKPGFVSLNYEIEAKGRIFKFLNFLRR